MARKKKGELPSGNIRRLVYNGMKQKIDKKTGLPVFDANGKPVMIRDYISVTAKDTKEVEREKCAAVISRKGKSKPVNMTLREAINGYIDSLRATRAASTIAGYETIRDNGFKLIMDTPIQSLTPELLQRAIDIERTRPSTSKRSKGKPISEKTLNNEWDLISTVLKKYHPTLNQNVSLPDFVSTVHELSRPEDIFRVVKGTKVELPVLLAMWLSFTVSEIKGLKKSTSIKGDYLYIADVVVHVNGKDMSKSIGKNKKRNRMHRIPPYIKQLIDQVETDQIVTMSGKNIYYHFTTIMKKNNMPHMSFHDLRHVNASVMSLLDIPDQYAMDRGGWSSDRIMKSTYMQIYQSERVAVDDKIDSYFESTLGLNPSAEDDSKYKAWLLLFDCEDTPENREEFSNFIQKTKNLG